MPQFQDYSVEKLGEQLQAYLDGHGNRIEPLSVASFLQTGAIATSDLEGLKDLCLDCQVQAMNTGSETKGLRRTLDGLGLVKQVERRDYELFAGLSAALHSMRKYEHTKGTNLSEASFTPNEI